MIRLAFWGVKYFSGGWGGGCWNQPPNHLVEEGQPQVFTPFLKSREVLLCQETRDRPKSLGLVVPGDEADCVTLDALHLADILLLLLLPLRNQHQYIDDSVAFGRLP